MSTVCSSDSPRIVPQIARTFPLFLWPQRGIPNCITTQSPTTINHICSVCTPEMISIIITSCTYVL